MGARPGVELWVAVVVRTSTRTPAVSGAAQIRRVASMPSSSGVRMSISTTCGRWLTGELHRRHTGAGLADRGEAGGGVDEDAEAAAQQRLVVGHQDPDRLGQLVVSSRAAGRVLAGPSGSRADTANPPRGRVPASKLPPYIITRSRIPTRPCPPARSGRPAAEPWAGPGWRSPASAPHPRTRRGPASRRGAAGPRRRRSGPRSEAARDQRPLDLLDRLGDLDAARAGVGAVEGRAAAPDALLVVEDLQALLAALVAASRR